MARKQKELPGLEDPELPELKQLAEEYATIRDERMKLTAREVELKDSILAQMHKHRKRKYSYGGVSIEVVTEKEKVKVWVAKPEEPEPEEAAPAPQEAA